MRRIAVGDLLVLGGGVEQLLVLEQQLGQQKVVLRGVGVLWERADVGAVPAHRLLVVGAGLALLRQRMVMARELGEVGLDQRPRALPALGVGLAALAVDRKSVVEG